MSNLVGSFGRANLALAGLAAGIGILVVGGKSMIDIAEKHEKATNSLEQAVAAYNSEFGKTAVIGGATAAELAKLSDAQGKAQDALTISHNAVTKAQMAYTAAVHAHGAKSDQARIAALNLQDANIHLKQAQDALTDSTGTLTAAQANVGVATTHGIIYLDSYKKQIDDFINSNRRFISDQSEVIDGYAKLTRAGISVDETQKDMNRALDLAALKHISVAEAVDLLVKAENGRFRGLIDLGISTGKYTDAQGNLINGTKDVGRAMGELDDKTKKGRDTLTSLQQHSNELSNDWQNLSQKGGPVLLILLDKVVNGVKSIYDWFDRTGKDNKLWSQISDRLVDMAKWIKQYLLDPLSAAGGWLDRLGGSGPGSGKDSSWTTSPLSHLGGRASGGPVLPGGIYTVGERGPETLVMGANGGMVIPRGGSGGGAGITVHLNGSNLSPWDVANEIAWAKKTQRL